MFSSLTLLPIFCCWHLFLSLAALVSSRAAPLCCVRHPTTSTNEPISTAPTGRPTPARPAHSTPTVVNFGLTFQKQTLSFSQNGHSQNSLFFNVHSRSHPKWKRKPVLKFLSSSVGFYQSKFGPLQSADPHDFQLEMMHNCGAFSFNLCPVCIFPLVCLRAPAFTPTGTNSTTNSSHAKCDRAFTSGRCF